MVKTLWTLEIGTLLDALILLAILYLLFKSNARVFYLTYYLRILRAVLHECNAVQGGETAHPTTSHFGTSGTWY